MWEISVCCPVIKCEHLILNLAKLGSSRDESPTVMVGEDNNNNKNWVNIGAGAY